MPNAEAARLLDALDDELATFQYAERGRFRAHWWYCRQVMRSVRALRASDFREATNELDTRRSTSLIDSVARDFRFGARTLWRAPGFSTMVVGTLALGIGATTAMFSVVDTVLLRDLPYVEPEQIFRVWAQEDNGDIENFSFRVVEYQELARRGSPFTAVAGEFPVSLSVVIPGVDPMQLPGRMVTPHFFRVFGTGPVLGRMFTAEEIAGGAARVVVVSHRFWTRHLRADPQALGRPLDLDGRPYMVIGVLPGNYHHVSGDADLFVPYTIGTSGWTARWLDVFGRAPVGATPDQLAAEISSVMRAITAAEARPTSWHASVEGLHQMVVSAVRSAVLATFAAVVLVLLIACVNVANLTLARATSRTNEVALRVALGASRGRVVRQLFIESLLLAMVGGLAGLAVGWLALRALVSWAPPSIPRIGDAGIDPAAVLFSIAVIATTAVAFGLAPALRSTRRFASVAGEARIRTTARDARFGGALGALVIVEVALALALLVGAGLMIRTFQALSAEEFGFQRDAAFTFRVNVPSARWPGTAGVLTFYDQLREGLLAIPGVVAVGGGSDLPLGGQGAVATVTSEARAIDGQREGVTTLQRRATVGFLEALDTPLIAGRTFDRTDGPDTPRVAVISAALARQLFPAEGAVGQRVAFGSRPGATAWMTVIGVVADMRFQRADQVDDPQIYQAHVQSATREMAVVVRTTSDALSLLDPARAVVAALDPRIPLYQPGSLQSAVDEAVAGPRFTMSLFSMLAVVAVVLAAAGIYGVVAFAVGRRRRELGVRLALGARPTDIVRLIVREGMVLVATGLTVGLLIALGGARVLDGLVYGVHTIDPATYVLVTAMLAAAGVGACYLPAKQGARLDPARILRSD